MWEFSKVCFIVIVYRKLSAELSFENFNLAAGSAGARGDDAVVGGDVGFDTDLVHFFEHFARLCACVCVWEREREREGGEKRMCVCEREREKDN